MSFKHVFMFVFLSFLSTGWAAAQADEQAQRQQQIWNALERSAWIQDGSTKASRTIYVFTDPVCPYCHKFWNESREWIDNDKVQVRYIVVGIIKPESPLKAAALLNSPNPTAALALIAYRDPAARAKGIDGYKGEGATKETIMLKPTTDIAPDIQKKLEYNQGLMSFLRFRSVPAVVWIDEQGTLRKRSGIPEESLNEILGPK